MRYLITGGAGFIGSHMVRHLMAEGREVRVLDNFSTGSRANLEGVGGALELVEGDIRDLPAVKGVIRGCEAVVHLAALPSVPRSIADPSATHEANATGTLNVLLAARDEGVERVVYASSSSIYGAAPELPKRESTFPEPISPYAVSKLAGERYCRSFFEVFGLETVALRYFNVFGPRQDPASEYAAVIPKFIWAYRHGEPPVIFGDGEQSRDFTYVDNVVDANLAALKAPGVGGRVYNVACGERTTLNELAEILREQTGARVNAVHGPPRTGDIRHSLADVTRARNDLGYAPAISVAEGLRQTVTDALGQEAARGHHHVIRAVRSPKPSGRARGTTPPGRQPRRPAGRFLITGGAGFIGSHLVDALAARQDCEQLVILDDLSTGRRAHVEHLLDGRVQLVEGSVADAGLVDELMKEVDHCVHLASVVGVQKVIDEPLETLMYSARGGGVVMHAAARHGARVLFSSTSEVYGKATNGALREDDDLVIGSPAKSRWAYAIAKSFGEALIAGYNQHRGVDTTVVRLFNTVGPGQTGAYGMVLPRFVRQALNGEDLTVFGSGAQTRCFTHVKDTVAALILLAANDGARGKTFNVGTSTPVAIVELARRVIERAGSSSGIVLVPYEEAYGDGFEELGRRSPDTTALRNLTGWQPQRTIDDAIDDVIAYERARLTADTPERVAADVS